MDLDREFVYVGDGGFTELSGRSRRYGLDLEGRLGIFDASSVVSSPLSVVVSLDEGINKQRTTDDGQTNHNTLNTQNGGV